MPKFRMTQKRRVIVVDDVVAADLNEAIEKFARILHPLPDNMTYDKGFVRAPKVMSVSLIVGGDSLKAADKA